MAVAVTACVAASGDHPPYVPTRDVVVVYRMVSDTAIGGIPVPQSDRITFAYSSQSGRMRVDTGEDDYTIIDRGADRLYVVSPARRAVRVQRAVSSGTPEFLMRDGATYKRAGSETIAGLPCTVWRIQRDEPEATSCVTLDGVVTRYVTNDPGLTHTSVEALSVVYVATPAVRFEPPPGYQGMEMVEPTRR
jgi:hypothetical protein